MDRDGRSDKAKGKAAAEVDDSLCGSHPPTDDSIQQESLLVRIAGSASELGKSLISGQPSGADVAAVASNEKVSDAGSRAQRGESSSQYWLPPAGPAAQASSKQFRTGHVQDHTATQEAEFSNFLDGVDLEEPANPGSIQPRYHSGKHAVPLASSHERSGSAIEYQEAVDGGEVVDLLAQGDEYPTFDEELGLSDEELAGLRKALFNEDGKSSGSEDWDNILNFIPDFLRPDPDGTYGNEYKSAETLGVTGLEHSGEGSRLWIIQWQNLLERYTDEVWGDLAALKRTAQKELQEIEARPEASPANTKALQRLRQILGHIRDS